MPDAVPSTYKDFVNVLGRTAPGAVVKVGGQAVTVLGTVVSVRKTLKRHVLARRGEGWDPVLLAAGTAASKI